MTRLNVEGCLQCYTKRSKCAYHSQNQSLRDSVMASNRESTEYRKA